MDQLQQALRRLEQSFATRAAKAPKTTSVSARMAFSDVQQTLDLFADEEHDAHPPLFAAHAHLPRRYHDEQRVRLPSGKTVIYRGEALHQDDSAVWHQLLKLVRAQGGHERIEFSPRSILKAMGWGVSEHDKRRLRVCLERMQASYLALDSRDDETTLGLSLISRCEWRLSPAGRSGRWRVWIASEVQALFAGLLN